MIGEEIRAGASLAGSLVATAAEELQEVEDHADRDEDPTRDGIQSHRSRRQDEDENPSQDEDPGDGRRDEPETRTDSHATERFAAPSLMAQTWRSVSIISAGPFR